MSIISQLIITCQTIFECDNIGAMRPRHFTPIESLPLVGERLCLDFTNTTGNRGGTQPRERLNTYHDLVVFGRRTGIVEGDAEEALVRFSREQPDSAARVPFT